MKGKRVIMSQEFISGVQQVPDYLTPVGEMVTGCVLTSDPQLKLDREGKPAETKFDQRRAYQLRVRTFGGTRVDTFPDGSVSDVPIWRDMTVTVWLKSEPQFKAGDKVRFLNLCVGGMVGNRGDSVTYWQAFGVTKGLEQKKVA